MWVENAPLLTPYRLESCGGYVADDDLQRHDLHGLDHRFPVGELLHKVGGNAKDAPASSCDVVMRLLMAPYVMVPRFPR
jgi:hypothetical protein